MTVRILPTFVAAAFAVVALLHPASSASAQSDDERARLHFSAGRSYYEEGSYEQALVEFQRSYDLSQRAVLLVNVANSLERLGRWREAADSLEQYVATLEEADAARATLVRRIENLRQRAAQHEAGESAPAEPIEQVADPAPHSPSDETTAPAADTIALPQSQQGTDGLLVPSLVAFGVAAAGLATFATLGGLALAEESSIAEGCGATSACTPAQVRTMDDLATGADVALAAGLVALATGAVLIIVDPPHGGSTESASIRVAPFGGQHGAGVSVHGSF